MMGFLRQRWRIWKWRRRYGCPCALASLDELEEDATVRVWLHMTVLAEDMGPRIQRACIQSLSESLWLAAFKAAGIAA